MIYQGKELEVLRLWLMGSKGTHPPTTWMIFKMGKLKQSALQAS